MPRRPKRKIHSKIVTSYNLASVKRVKLSVLPKQNFRPLSVMTSNTITEVLGNPTQSENDKKQYK